MGIWFEKGLVWGEYRLKPLSVPMHALAHCLPLAPHPTSQPVPLGHLAISNQRYVEHKLELDAIRAAAEKMQRQLDDTHRQLQGEVTRRMALQDESARAKVEAGRAKELAVQIAAERCLGGNQGVVN